MSKGIIIVIEGIDGSGKQTQAEMLMLKLKTEKVPCIKHSFPTYNALSSAPVKMYLGGELSSTADEIDAYQSSVLFAVDRLCTYYSYLKPYYENGEVIIFDRYVESNMIHQAGKIKDKIKRDNFISWLKDFEYGLLKLPKPDLVIFLDMPPKVSESLAKERGSYKTGKKIDIHEADPNHLNDAYKAGKEVAINNNWKIISCVDEQNKLKSIEDINDEIFKIVKPII